MINPSKFQLLIFDLDGTLIDSKRDLALAVNATRVHMGLPAIDNEVAASWVGNGVPVLIRRAMGPESPDAEVARAQAFFMEYYFAHILDNTVLYPGVREGLDCLRDAGVRMAVLTNKPLRFTQVLLDGLGVASLFFRVYGGDSFDRKKPDPAGITALRAEAGGVVAENTLMVGDSSVDIQTARNARVPVCGVTWGLKPESLHEYPPDVLVDRMEDLTAYVFGHRPPGLRS